MKKMLLALAGAALVATAHADGVAVYKSAPSQDAATNSFGAVGYDVVTHDLRERGDTVTLAAGPRNITEVGLYYLWATGNVAGDEGFRIKFYALDGPVVAVVGGVPTNAPGTLIWDSGPITPVPGDTFQRVAVPNITVPDTFALVWQAVGVTQTYGTDQHLWDAFGAMFFGPSQIGVSGTNNGENWAWRRNHPTDPWDAQDFTPGGPPPGGVAGHADFGFTVWANGGPTVPYDNTVDTTLNAFFATLDENGDDIGLEGTNRSVSAITLEYNSDKTTPAGNEGVIVRMYRRATTGHTDLGQVQGAPVDPPLFQSAEIPIDASTGSHMVTIPVGPAVTVPNDIVVSAVFTNQTAFAGDSVGFMIRTPPATGGSNTRFWEKLTAGNPEVNGWEGNEAFGVTYPTNPVANLSMKLTAGPASTIITEDSVTLGPGIVLSGVPSDLNTSNDVYYTLRPGVVISSAQSPIVLTWIGHAPGSSPSSLSSTVEARAQQANCRQTIEVFNYSTALYEQLNQQVLPTSTPDTVVTSNIANPAQHIGTGNEVKLKISYKAVGPILSYPWRIFMDQVIETYTP